MILWIRKQIILKQQKFTLRVLLSFCLIFFQLQPGVSYKSVAYKKDRILKVGPLAIKLNTRNEIIILKDFI